MPSLAFITEIAGCSDGDFRDREKMMTEPPLNATRIQTDLKSFAEARSHGDAAAVNDHWKSICSSSLLISTGVTGTLLAGLFSLRFVQISEAQQQSVHNLKLWYTVAIAFFFGSIILSLLMNLFHVRSTTAYMLRWEKIFWVGEGQESKLLFDEGKKWERHRNGVLYLVLGCFVIGGFCVGLGYVTIGIGLK